MGELLEISSEAVVGKHLAKKVGFNREKQGSRTGSPCGTNLLAAPSSGCLRPGSVQGDPEALFSAFVPVIGPGTMKRLRAQSGSSERVVGQGE